MALGPGISGSRVQGSKSLTVIVSPDAVLVPDRNSNSNSGRGVPDNTQKTGKRQRESNVHEEGEGGEEGEEGDSEASSRRGSRGGGEVGLGQADFIAMPAEEDGKQSTAHVTQLSHSCVRVCVHHQTSETILVHLVTTHSLTRLNLPPILPRSTPSSSLLVTSILCSLHSASLLYSLLFSSLLCSLIFSSLILFRRFYGL